MGSTLDELASCDHKDSIRGHDGGQPEQDSGDKNDAAAYALSLKGIPHICHFFYTSKIFGE